MTTGRLLRLDRMRNFPAGRRRGLKLDKPARIMERCNSIRKAAGFEVIAEDHWDELADSRWHTAKRDCYRYTSDQDGLGSCAAESENNTKAALDTRQGQPLIIYNPLGTYHTTSGGRDMGSVVGDNLEFGRETGCFPEEVWPRSKGFKKAPSAAAVTIAGFFKIREFFYLETIQEFISALLQGFFVHAGYDGHAVSFCCYLKKGMLLFKNSWGNWGDNGFGQLAASSVYFGYGAYAYKDVAAYYDPVKKLFGRFENDGTFTPCPWTPTLNQAALGKAVMEYVQSVGSSRMSDTQAEDAYRQRLAKFGLAV